MVLKDLLLLTTGMGIVAGEAFHKIDESGQITRFEATFTRANAFSASGLHEETSVQHPSPLERPLYFFSGSVPSHVAAFTITDQWR